MSDTAERLKKMAEDKLSCVHEYIEKARSELEVSLDKCKDEVEDMIGQLKNDLVAKKHQADANKTKIEKTVIKQKEVIGTKFSELKEKVESKKDEKVRKRVLVKAEKAEKHAELCMDYASLAVVEAEIACLEAAQARLKAEEILGSED